MGNDEKSALTRGASHPVVQPFALDELCFVLSAPTPQLLQQVTTLWCDSFFLKATDHCPNRVTPPIVVAFRQPPWTNPPLPTTAPIYQTADLTVQPTPTGFCLSCGTSRLLLDLENTYAWGLLVPDFGETRPQDQRDFFLLMFLMFGHRRGYYGLHANALSDGRRDFLIIGPSGSGKSTLTVRLLGQGWRCGGDDVVLLRRDPGPTAAILAKALRRDFALTAKTLATCFPGTATAPVKALQQEKQIVAASALVPTALREEFCPACLFFATIVDQATSALVPLTPMQALVALAQQSAGIMTDRAIGQQQLRLLTELCRQAASYQLQLGRDVFQRPDAVGALLQSS